MLLEFLRPHSLRRESHRHGFMHGLVHCTDHRLRFHSPVAVAVAVTTAANWALLSRSIFVLAS
ncbi:hypothetical protein RchiOBHm_Chr2g0089521 [Rosa chinensis]|uniref:Uncharacterized protein n=1 Tax=Rosa chinensis TaxID=74649 RepID=A0A2P6RJ70_ROSCH|nr:hypothetical protein RchiOBHm_Chr2g0089521 [Rosa chinensis]